MHVSILAALNTSFSWFIYRCRSEISCSCCSATAAWKANSEMFDDVCDRQTSWVRTAAEATLHLFPDVDELIRIWSGARRSRWGAQSLHQSQATNTSWNRLRNQQRPSYNGCLMLKRSSLISPKPLIQGWGITGLFFTSSLACCWLSHENVYESDKTKTKKKAIFSALLFSNVWLNVIKVPLEVPRLLFCSVRLELVLCLNHFQSYKVVSLLRRELGGLLSHIPVKAVWLTLVVLPRKNMQINQLC